MVRTILILAANPTETPRLRLDEEVREISEGLRRSRVREKFIIRTKWAVRIRDIRRALLDSGPSIVHFTGHGSSTTGMLFENGFGEGKIIEPEPLADLLQLFSDTVQCVLLSGCYSEVQAKSIAKHIDYVIGIPKTVGDRAAIEFTVAFYDAVGAGKSIEVAYKFGLNAVMMSGMTKSSIVLLKNERHAIPRKLEVKELPHYDENLLIIKRFLEQMDAEITYDEGTKTFCINSVVGHLNSYTPIPVFFAENPSDKDIIKLIEKMHSKKVGILVFQQSPDALCRMQMAKARLQDKMVIIPVSLAVVKQSLLENTSEGVIFQYANRYLPGADIFDDRNAIGDTLSFFGRGSLLHKLEEELNNSEGVGVFGLRKSGKTSLMLQLGYSLKRHPIVHIDLQFFVNKIKFGSELFNEILTQLYKLDEVLGNTLEDERWNSSNQILFPKELTASETATQFTQLFEETTKNLYEKGFRLPVICFLDEIERIFPFPTDSKGKVDEFNAFFGTLRALSQNKKKLGILVADVHADCTNTNQWIQEGVSSNPMFNFFKEVFVPPFVEGDTKTMLNDIGQLMGISFDEQILDEIHIQSGGHPFIARQLASLLYNKCKGPHIQFSKAREYIKNPLSYSIVLKNYFSQNIWADLKKRKFKAAMDVLRIFSCREDTKNSLSEKKIIMRLGKDYTESECIDALLWLENVGLIKHEESKENSYQIIVPLMAKWLRMQMKGEELQQWQT